MRFTPVKCPHGNLQGWNRLWWWFSMRMVSVKLDLLTLTKLLANLKGVSLLKEFSRNELKFSSKCWESSVITAQSLQLYCAALNCNWIRRFPWLFKCTVCTWRYEELHFNQFIMQVWGLLGKTYQSLYSRRRFQYIIFRTWHGKESCFCQDIIFDRLPQTQVRLIGCSFGT